MHIPYEQHVAQHDTLDGFLAGVREAFEEAIAAYERTVQATEFHADMPTTSFAFAVNNGYMAEALLEDVEPYTDN